MTGVRWLICIRSHPRLSTYVYTAQAVLTEYEPEHYLLNLARLRISMPVSAAAAANAKGRRRLETEVQTWTTCDAVNQR